MARRANLKEIYCERLCNDKVFPGCREGMDDDSETTGSTKTPNVAALTSEAASGMGTACTRRRTGSRRHGLAEWQDGPF